MIVMTGLSGYSLTAGAAMSPLGLVRPARRDPPASSRCLLGRLGRPDLLGAHSSHPQDRRQRRRLRLQRPGANPAQRTEQLRRADAQDRLAAGGCRAAGPPASPTGPPTARTDQHAARRVAPLPHQQARHQEPAAQVRGSGSRRTRRPVRAPAGRSASTTSASPHDGTLSQPAAECAPGATASSTSSVRRRRARSTATRSAPSRPGPGPRPLQQAADEPGDPPTGASTSRGRPPGRARHAPPSDSIARSTSTRSACASTRIASACPPTRRSRVARRARSEPACSDDTATVLGQHVGRAGTSPSRDRIACSGASRYSRRPSSPVRSPNRPSSAPSRPSRRSPTRKPLPSTFASSQSSTRRSPASTTGPLQAAGGRSRHQAIEAGRPVTVDAPDARDHPARHLVVAEEVDQRLRIELPPLAPEQRLEILERDVDAGQDGRSRIRRG